MKIGMNEKLSRSRDKSALTGIPLWNREYIANTPRILYATTAKCELRVSHRSLDKWII